MNRIQRIFCASFFTILVLTLTGCKLALFDTQGIIATGEKNIMITSAWLMSIVVVPVIIMVFWIAWRYRESNKNATYTPNWSHSTALEIIIWTVPCIIITILSIMTWISSYEFDPYKPIAAEGEKTLEIQVVSLRWKWLFIYPEQNIATLNFVQIPVETPVRFVISAEGPMNSFQIPQLGGQIYAMAGMQTKLHLIADNTGDFPGSSVNFSGDGFANMRFTARVSTQEEFDAWVKTVKQSPKKLSMADYHQLVKPSEEEKVEYFASANKNIFEMVVMKTMMPMQNHMQQMMADSASK